MLNFLQTPNSDPGFHPLFFRINNLSQEFQLKELVENTPGIQIYDTILGQIRELVKSANPRHVYSPKELEEAAIQHLGDTPAEKYGVWVYYPWSKRLVHTLDEKEFVQVRTNRNMYKITPSEKETLAQKKIGIVGLSVGQSIAMTMAMERIFGEIVLADFDILELSNLNRIRSGLHNLDLPKTIMVAREMLEIDPFLKISCYSDGLSENNIENFLKHNDGLDLVVDVCDGLHVKIMLRQMAKSLGIPVVMDTSDRGMIDIERFDLEKDRKIFHGLIDHLDLNDVKKAKTNEEKIPFLLPMIGLDRTSPRLRASMLEIEQSITTWPQLASSVTLGGGITTNVCRRILLNELTISGRFYVDLEELIGGKVEVEERPLDLVEGISEEQISKEISNYQSPLQLDSLEVDEWIEEIVKAGCAATSGANSQSWKWRYQDKKLFLFFDVIYNAALLDPHQTTSIIGLGCATENVILKAHELNLEVHLDRPTVTPSNRLCAIFSFFDKSVYSSLENNFLENPIDTNLSKVIYNRYTNRNLSKRQTIPHQKLERLQALAELSEGIQLRLLSSDEELSDLKEITARMDRMRMVSELGHTDFRAEIRWTPEEAETLRNGIDLQRTVELTPSELAGWNVAKSWEVVQLLANWELGTGFEKMQRKWIDGSSAVGLVTCPKFDLNNFFEGGRAIQRIHLAANEMNIEVHAASISTLIFNTLNHGIRDELTPTLKSEAEILFKRFIHLYKIPHDTGLVLLMRFFVSDKPTGKSVRQPLTNVFTKG